MGAIFLQGTTPYHPYFIPLPFSNKPKLGQLKREGKNIL